eukprot:5506829-Amphidinium_carterae.1
MHPCQDRVLTPPGRHCAYALYWRVTADKRLRMECLISRSVMSVRRGHCLASCASSLLEGNSHSACATLESQLEEQITPVLA